MAEENGQISPEAAHGALFPGEDPKITIGGKEIAIKPFNLHGLDAIYGLVGDISKPYNDGARKFREARDAYVFARAANVEQTEVPEPDSLWWFDLVRKNITAVVKAVTIVLERGDSSVTEDWVRENLEPLVHLPQIVPIVIQANKLGDLAKKALTSEWGQMLIARASNLSGLGISRSTSPGTTGSSPASSPDAGATIP